MEQIGNNGYYIASNGAAYTYILSMGFDRSEMTENIVASSELDSENKPVYFNGDKTLMEEADWLDILNSIQDDTITWHLFEDSDWETYFR